MSDGQVTRKAETMDDRKFSNAPRSSEPQVSLYELMRAEDESGVSGTGYVADVVVWHDGKACVHWRTATTSTAVYDSVDDLIKIHGHGGKTRLVPRETPFENGRRCAEMDQMENAPFASIGGLEFRACPSCPSWVRASDFDEWFTGYEFACRKMYGSDWRECSFGWVPVLEIGS